MEIPHLMTLIDLFDETIKKNFNNLAVIFNKKRYTYNELDIPYLTCQKLEQAKYQRKN